MQAAYEVPGNPSDGSYSGYLEVLKHASHVLFQPAHYRELEEAVIWFLGDINDVERVSHLEAVVSVIIEKMRFIFEYFEILVFGAMECKLEASLDLLEMLPKSVDNMKKNFNTYRSQFCERIAHLEMPATRFFNFYEIMPRMIAMHKLLGLHCFFEKVPPTQVNAVYAEWKSVYCSILRHRMQLMSS